MKYTVAIPTYRRPDYLVRAVKSVLNQTLLPEELLIVSRWNDEATNLAIHELIRINRGPVLICNSHVVEPGFLPPVVCAIDVARGKILVLLDDDAEAHPDWLSIIDKYYDDPKVGGVGGRYINYFNGVLQHYPSVKRVGQLSCFGRSVGNMYCDCEFTGPVKVDFLIGGNLSYRLDLLRICKPDKRIGNNVAFHWEMDVGQQVKKLGYSILFDPAICVDHHTAPREISGMRTINYDGTYWSNFNYTLLMRKHLSTFGFLAFLLYSLAIGGAGAPGLIYLIFSVLRGRPVQWRDSVLASLRGRFDGMRA